MGKGDIKSKRGKISNGSYGVRRQKASTPAYVAPVAKAKAKPVAKEEEEAAPKKAAAKKPAAKKAPAKKAAAKKPAAKKAPAKKAAAKK